MNFHRLKQLHGLTGTVRFTASVCAELMVVNKTALIAARRANDDTLAAELSQMRQFLKHRAKINRCPGHALRECGVLISSSSNHCQLCAKEIRTGQATPKILTRVNLRTGLPSRYTRVKDRSVLTIALARCEGNASAAARMTGFSHKTVLRHAGNLIRSKGQRHARSITPQQVAEALNTHGRWTVAQEALGLNSCTFYRKLMQHRNTQTGEGAIAK